MTAIDLDQIAAAARAAGEEILDVYARDFEVETKADDSPLTEADQRAKESRKKSSNLTVKEMKYRPKIGPGDFDTKTKKVEKFLGEGHKVKVTIMFRGREMQHPELGRKILDNVAEEVEHVGKVEFHPRQDGRNMVMVLAPDKQAQARHEKERKKAEAAASADTVVEAPVTDEEE